ncbi:MAG TPA: hypothetical protein VG737_10405 [Cyclobacteriaceae bacterium]|nr:hypothetical protein [Cyclobacteriaceae bacterium]
MIRFVIAFFAWVILASCSGARSFTNWPSAAGAQSSDIINDSPELRERDALVARIDNAENMFPKDIAQSTLIIEILSYEDFRKLNETKYFVVPDSRKARVVYRAYKRQRKHYLKGFIAKKVYLEKGTYDKLDINKFRYVLETTARFTDYIGKESYPTNSWKIVEYIYDRKDGVLYCEFANPPPYDEMNRLRK